MVLEGNSDWTTAPEDADLPTFCPEPPSIFAYVLSIFFAVRYIFYHNSKQQIQNHNFHCKKDMVHSICQVAGGFYLCFMLVVLALGMLYAGGLQNALSGG